MKRIVELSQTISLWTIALLWIAFGCIILLSRCGTPLGCLMSLVLSIGTSPLVPAHITVRLVIIGFGIAWAESILVKLQSC
jgi:hypothetical protein